jgi:uncharacterized protein (DUF2252 family)
MHAAGGRREDNRLSLRSWAKLRQEVAMPGGRIAGSVRKPPRLVTRRERMEHGKLLRESLAREAHAEWSPPRRRADPVAVLIASGKRRIPSLLPIRYGRMAQSPFAYLRGAAAMMAADLAATPASGIRVQSCGDCHLLNFGAYLSPEGRPVFDVNDFDETLPAPFEWDLKRLATSIVVAMRVAGAGGRASAGAARSMARAYRKQIAALLLMEPAAAWQWTIDFARAIDGAGNARLRARLLRDLRDLGKEAKAVHRHERGRDGRWRIVDKEPLVYHFDARRDGKHALDARAAFAQYRETLQEDRRVLLDRYRLEDVAFKVVGTGSIGTFCAAGLFMSADEEPLYLQIKEARESVLAPCAGASRYANQGQRVVTGQRMMQAASDVFLGWTSDGPESRYFYVRRLKDRHLDAIGRELEEEALLFYAELCGRTLARAHARAGDAALIAGYVGSGRAFDHAIADFACAYADQTERDYALFLAAIKEGRLAAVAV